MVHITLYGGVNEIGGNKVLINDGDTNVMLDFGRRMGKAEKFYEEFIQVRSKCALLDLLKLGILPKIDGIYPQQLLDRTTMADEDISSHLPLDEASDYWKQGSLEPYDPTRGGIDAVFISHAHFDHIQDVSFLHRDIPVYCSETTRVLVKAITDVSTSGIEYRFYDVDECIKLVFKDVNYRTVFPNALEYKQVKEIKEITDPKSGYTFTMEVKRSPRSYVTEGSGQVGNIGYRFIPAGHSIPGAASIILTSSEGKKILYTGDIRFHGHNEITLEEYLKNFEDSSIDILICEGTRVGSEKTLTEDDVHGDLLERAARTEGLLLVDFGWKDTTRFNTIAKVAKGLDRKFIINPKLAYLLYELHLLDGKRYPDPMKMEHVLVYKKRLGGLLYSRSDYDKFKAGYLEHWGRNLARADKNIVRIAEKLGIGGERYNMEPLELAQEERKAWDLATHHIERGVPSYEIRKEPDRYILMFSFFDANELFDLSTPDGKLPGARYIRASCEPFNDEMEIDERKLMNWLDRFGVEYEIERDEKGRESFKRAHVSGHASRPELKELIDKIAPKTLIPIHTEDPEAFKEIVQEIEKDIHAIIPEMGKRYTF